MPPRCGAARGVVGLGGVPAPVAGGRRGWRSRVGTSRPRAGERRSPIHRHNAAAGAGAPTTEVTGTEPAPTQRPMKAIPPPRSLAWWTVLVCSLAAVGIFMVFEVWDLDGSDLFRRIFQPSIASQSALADSERVMRHGALGVRDTLSRLRTLAAFQESPPLLSDQPCTAPGHSGTRRPGIGPRTHMRPTPFRLSPPSEEPPTTPDCVG